LPSDPIAPSPDLKSSRPVALLAVVLGVSGCLWTDRVVEFVHVDGAEIPAAAAFAVIPYDLAELRDSLEALAADPRPSFPGLWEEMRDWVRPDPSLAADVHDRWQRARANVRALSDTLYGLSHTSPEYEAAYSRFRDRYAELVRNEAALEQSLRDLTDTRLADRVSEAADSLRAWERATFGEIERLASALRAASGRSEQIVVFNSGGLSHSALAPGRWWLIGRISDPDNPFFEREWYVPFSTNGLVPTVVPIRDRHVTLRWRH
jgi:hypothetical protein